MKTNFFILALAGGLSLAAWAQTTPGQRGVGPGDMGLASSGSYPLVSVPTNGSARAFIDANHGVTTADNRTVNNGSALNGVTYNGANGTGIPTKGANNWNSATNQISTWNTNWSRGPTNYSGSKIPGANPGPPTANSPGTTGPR